MSVAAIGAVDYAKALDGLSLKQAQLMLTTQGIVGEEQKDLLVKQGLIATSDRMSASLVAEALADNGLDKELQDSILIKAQLMNQDSKLLITENAITEAKLRAILAEKGIKGAKADTLIASILQTGQNAKEAVSWRVLGTAAKDAMIAMLHNPLTWIIAGIASIGLLVKGYDAVIGKQEKLSRTKIEGLDEDISKLDEEIKSLEGLQTKLKEAKGNKAELAKIQNEINDAIGDTPGLINGEADAYNKANIKLQAYLATKKQEREQARLDRINESKLLFDNNAFELDWRADVTGEGMRNYAKSREEHIKSEMVNGKTREEADASWEGWSPNINLPKDDWEKYWREQVEIAHDAFSGVIEDYEGYGGQDFVKNLIENMVRGGADLSEISEVVQAAVNNEQLQEAIDTYWESLINPDINSEEALANVKKQFDEIIKLFPGLEDFFNGVYSRIVAGSGEVASATEESVDKTTASIGVLEKASEKINTLSSAFKELSDDGHITTKTLREIQDATGLSGDEWEDYQDKLMRAKVGSAEFNQIMSDLTYKILENEFATVGLENATEQQIAAVLRENGGVNAEAVAHDVSVRAKTRAKVAAFDFVNATEAETSVLYEELKALGLTEVEINNLASAYASAQQAMLEATSTGAAARLKIEEAELKAIKGIADVYAILGRGYDTDGDGTLNYAQEELDEMSPDEWSAYKADRAKIMAYGNAVEALKKIEEINIDIPDYSGDCQRLLPA